MGVVLSGGKIINANATQVSDIRIDGEKIVAIGKNITQPGDEVIDVKGCYIFPGGIDAHTHFDLDVGFTKTSDDFLTGTKAAVAGGTTTVINYATQYKGETLRQALENEMAKAEMCYTDFGFHMGITSWNSDVALEIPEMIKAGVTSFKLYLAYKNNLQVDDGVVYQVLQTCKKFGGLVTFHCENGDLIEVLVNEAIKSNRTGPVNHALTRPDTVEKEAVARVIDIAELVDTPVYIVHLSTEKGLKEIQKARKAGQKVYAETCPQYLLLDDSLYLNEGEKYVMSPPLRKPADKAALWEGLSINDIDTIATDHCSFNYQTQKLLGKDDFRRIPNGAPGVEDRFGLIYTYGVLTGKLSLNQLAEKLSANPAKLFGLYPQKGAIDIGSDADIVVFDPDYETTITVKRQIQNVDYNPYEGFTRKGKFRYVYLRGKRIVEDEQVIGSPCGEYLYRKPFQGGI